MGRRRAAALLDRQPTVRPSTAPMPGGGDRASWRRARADRLDGAAREGRRDPAAARRLPLPRFRHRRSRNASTTPSPANCAPRSTTARSTARAASSPARWTSRSASGVGKLFRLDPDLTLTVLDTGIICSNGPCWSPDGRTFYFADTTRKVIYAYDYDIDTGDVRSRRVCQLRHPSRPSRRRHGRRGRLCLERRGLFRPADPLRPRRASSTASSACRWTRRPA